MDIHQREHIFKMLNEFQCIQHEGLPLYNLIEKNLVKRGLSNEEVADMVRHFYFQRKIKLSNEAAEFKQFDLLVVAHYELLHKKNNN